jgi:psiF repeat
MLRTFGIISLMSLMLPLLLLATPASAISRKDKMDTCTFGANDQKLTGAKRKVFIRRCMANGDYEPPGRTVHKKPVHKKHMAKKPVAKTKMAKKPMAKPMPAEHAPAQPKTEPMTEPAQPMTEPAPK